MKSKIALALTVLALGALPFVSHAQDDNGGPGGPPPADMGDGGPGGPPPEDGGGGGFNHDGGPGGGFDPAQFQQRMLEAARKNLNVTNDEEWAAIRPLLQNVMDARREAHTGGGIGMFGPPGGNGRGGPGGHASAEQQVLQKAVEANAPVSEIKDALAKLRAAQSSKQAKLEAAQADLKNVLSVKQEAQAVLMGLLP